MQEDKKVILMIDDEEGACDFVKSYLEDRNYVVFTAFTGMEGIRLIKEKKPLLTLLDIRMPDMNGIDVLAQLKSDNVTAKIVVVTGLESGPELDKAKELGALDVLAKPIQLQVLGGLIKKYV